MKRHDADQDGMMSRSELRSAVLEPAGGEPLRFLPGYLPSELNEKVLSLIDVNWDWRLSAEEIERAYERLKRAELDGDGWLTFAEVDEVRREPPIASHPLGTRISGLQETSTAVRLLRKHYADSRGRILRRAFRISPPLFDQLDGNRDGELDDAELAQIVMQSPHLTFSNDQRDAVDEQKDVPLLLKSISPDFHAGRAIQKTEAPFHQWFTAGAEFEVRRLIVSARDGAETWGKFRLDRYDRNRNGYLERSEIDAEEGLQPEEFAAWDLNGDGRIPIQELKTALEQQSALSGCWIWVALTRRAPRVWEMLDSNKDNRLSARELRELEHQLKQMDADGDGEVQFDEIPFEFTIHIGRGDCHLPWVRWNPAYVVKPLPGPKWFQHMDGNGDGDVSQREFLGTLEQFERLDVDHDGFIDSREAEAAKR